MMSSTLKKMVGLHPLIKMYYDYITYTFVAGPSIPSMRESS